MEIILMGLVSVFCIVWYSLRDRLQKREIVELKKGLGQAEVTLRMFRDCGMRTESRYQDRICSLENKADVLEKENEQFYADITAFRSELGLGPRDNPEAK